MYLSAESYYQLNDYQQAADLFQRVADGYPKFHMAGEALYMVAESYQVLKQSGAVSVTQADSKIRLAYEMLINKYPGCRAATVAKSWLDKNGAK